MSSAVDTSVPGWNCECSDEELMADDAGDKDLDGTWAPPPSILEQLYLEIEHNGTLALEWKCMGRVPPSSASGTAEAAPSPTPSRDEPDPQDINSDFDFKDEMNSLRLRVRREGEDTLRGSAKKKTTSFDGIVYNMMRHKKMQQRLDMNPDNNS